MLCSCPNEICLQELMENYTFMFLKITIEETSFQQVPCLIFET